MNLYLRSRKILLCAVVLLTLLIAMHLFGARHVLLSNSYPPSKLPIRIFIVQIIAIVLVGSLASPVRLSDLDDVGPLKEARRIHLLAGLLGCAVLILFTSRTAGTLDEISLMRSLGAAAGLALLSFVLLGQRLYWVLPLAGLISLSTMGGFGTDAIEWNWLYAQNSSVLPMVLSGGLFLIGVIVFLLNEEGQIQLGLFKNLQDSD